MNTINDFATKEAELKEQLRQIEADRIKAEERQKAEQLDQIAAYEEEAATYRNQAAKALTDDDKRRLYRFADDAEEAANELRKQLGIVPVIGPDVEAIIAAENNRLSRSINRLLFGSLATFFAFLLADFTSGHLELGFTSYALKYAGLLLFNISGAFGGVWLACSILRAFMLNYSLSDLRNDFNESSPNLRIAAAVILLASVLFYLTALVPHAN